MGRLLLQLGVIPGNFWPITKRLNSQMNASDSNSPFNDASYSRERLELETRVLAAALRQSLEIGDTEGSSLAHEQIFLLLKASQEMHIDEPISMPREVLIDRGRQLPDIDWGSSEPAEATTTSSSGTPSSASTADEPHVSEPAAEHTELAGISADLADLVEMAAAATDNNFAPPVEQAVAVPEAVSESAPQPLPESMPVTEPVAEAPTSPEAAPAAANDYYGELNVTDLADFSSIHLAFWRMLRVLLLQEVGLVGPERLPHLRRIQRLWIAHDILCDPVTRADYDFRRMGLRGDDDAERQSQGSRGPRTQLRIGELLQCAGLLEQTELDIAADMHKAMPEMMFGTFLVKQGFIEEADLDCVLVGQQLLKTGDITVVQFQTVMIERSATGLDIGEMLLAKGYVNEFLLERAYRNQSEDTLVKVPIVVAPGQVTKIESKAPVQEAPKPEAPVVDDADSSPIDESALEAPVEATFEAHVEAPVEASTEPLHAMLDSGRSESQDNADASEAQASEPSLVDRVEAARATLSDTNFISGRSLQISNAAPAWKDQLDWSSPDAAEEAPAEDSQEADTDLAAAASAPNAVAPLNPEALADSVRAIAQIWAAEPDPVSVWSRAGAQAQAQAKAEAEAQAKAQAEAEAEAEARARAEAQAQADAEAQAQLDANAQTLDHARALSHTAFETPQEATGPLGTVDDSGDPLTTGDNPFLSPVEETMSPTTEMSDELVADVMSGIASATGESSDAGAIDDFVSEIETSSQLPSLIELEAKAHNRDKHKNEPKRGTGDWQIMSVPGSALTSLFLDEEPEAPPEGANAFIADEDQYQTGPRKGIPPLSTSDPTQPKAPDTIPPGDQSSQQAQTIPPKDSDAPPDGESRKARRRRTRS